MPTPVVFLQSEEQPATQPPKPVTVHESSVFKTYEPIKAVLLLASQVLTVSDKDVIKVWDIAMQSEVGQFREHATAGSRIELIREWYYPDIFAEENGSTEDTLYDAHCRERRFCTLSADSQVRIFSIDQMRLERSFAVDLKYVTAMAFLPDKALLCVGGRVGSEFQLMAMGVRKPRYRTLKFFSLATLAEYRSFRLPCHEQATLNCLCYTLNRGDRRYSRLNHILAVHIEGKLTFLFLDHENQCNVLMSFSDEQLGNVVTKSIVA